MQETANERLVREAARDVALEAMRRNRACLREVEAEPLTDRLYEAEWVTENGIWPVSPMPAEVGFVFVGRFKPGVLTFKSVSHLPFLSTKPKPLP